MPRWTVGELKARLDDYGDHLPVVITVEEPDTALDEVTDFEVDDGNSPTLNEPVVRLEV